MIIDYSKYIHIRKECISMNKQLERLSGKNAYEILKENGISLDPPIDLQGLMKQLGITVRAHDFSTVEDATGYEKDSILGAAILIKDNLMILYKKYENPRNDHGLRFTIAHELGHCVLHAEDLNENHLELRNDLYNKNDSREMEVNRFAGQLLVPEESLINISQQLVIPSISALAKIFDVSIGVMRERLKETNIKYYEDV